ncbi:MAG: transcription termination factor Rho [Chloroflexi bacterium]|nr:transcription termination factor Rho [Chloroflexota bacterium]
MNENTPLENYTLAELRALARQEGLSGYSRLKKDELLQALKKHLERDEEIGVFTGYLDIAKDGKGYLRGYRMKESRQDVYVSPAQIKRFGLRSGDLVKGTVRKPKEGEKYRSLLQVMAVNDIHPEDAIDRPSFDKLTPIHPEQQYILETRPYILGARFIDLVAPVGRGQRGLIVSPPKAGKSTLLKQIANGVAENYPGVHVMVVLVGERPEEVTDMQRAVKADVLSSTFAEPPEQHIHVAEMALNHAVRLAELNRDVVLLLDSLTRLVRAYDMVMPPSGRTLAGGLDPAALHPAKQFFGAARKLEDGGSLTIVATCTVDAGSRLDDAIYEEFRDAANMELRLDGNLAQRRIFPAIDIDRSGTRHEELLLDEHTVQAVRKLRRMVEALRVSQPGVEPLLAVRERLRRTRTNREFLASLNHRD